MAEPTMGSCDHCDADAIVIVSVAAGLDQVFSRRGCLDHLDEVFAMMGNIVSAAAQVRRPP